MTQTLDNHKGNCKRVKLSNLRFLAQQHLDEIDEMTRKELLEEDKGRAELGYEAKRKERRQWKHSPPAQEESDGKKARMRTAQGSDFPW